MGRGLRDGSGRTAGRRRLLARALTPAGLAACVALAAAACATERIEYRERSFATVLGGEEQVTLENGTMIVYAGPDDRRRASRPRNPDAKPLRTREELDDGTVILRAFMPQDVLGNFLTCLRNREYEIFWEQLVAEQAKMAEEHAGQGMEQFVEHCKENRNELAATMSRILLGLSRNEAMLENKGAGVIRLRLYPRIASQFKYKAVDVVSEPGGMRLLAVH